MFDPERGSLDAWMMTMLGTSLWTGYGRSGLFRLILRRLVKVRRQNPVIPRIGVGSRTDGPTSDLHLPAFLRIWRAPLRWPERLI